MVFPLNYSLEYSFSPFCAKTPVSPSIPLKVIQLKDTYIRVPCFFFNQWYLFSFASKNNDNLWLCSVWTKTNVNEQKRLPASDWVDLPIRSHCFLECCLSSCTLLWMSRGIGQHLIADWVYNNPISTCSKIPLPQFALAFHKVLHAVSQVFHKMLP